MGRTADLPARDGMALHFLLSERCSTPSASRPVEDLRDLGLILALSVALPVTLAAGVGGTSSALLAWSLVTLAMTAAALRVLRVPYGLALTGSRSVTRSRRPSPTTRNLPSMHADRRRRLTRVRS